MFDNRYMSAEVAMAQLLVQCGAWRRAGSILDIFIKSDHAARNWSMWQAKEAYGISQALAMRGEIELCNEWHLGKACSSFQAAREIHLDLPGVGVRGKTHLAFCLAVHGSLRESATVLRTLARGTRTAALADLVESAACKNSAMVPLIQAAAKYALALASEPDLATTNPVSTSAEKSDFVYFLATAVANMPPLGPLDSLLDAQLQLASLLSSLGDQMSSQRHLASAALQTRQQGLVTVARGAADARLLRETLLAIAPTVLASSDEGQAWRSSCAVTNLGIIGGRGRCGQSMAALRQLLLSVSRDSSWNSLFASSPLDLGVRWHFLTAYLGADTHDLMAAATRAQLHLAPSLQAFELPEKNTRASRYGSCAHGESLAKRGFQQSPARLAFLSGHWRFHSVGRLLSNIIASLAVDDRFTTFVVHTSARAR